MEMLNILHGFIIKSLRLFIEANDETRIVQLSMIVSFRCSNGPAGLLYLSQEYSIELICDFFNLMNRAWILMKCADGFLLLV